MRVCQCHQCVKIVKIADGIIAVQVGCDLSHLRLLHRLLGGDTPLVLIMEDDIDIPPGDVTLFSSCRIFGRVHNCMPLFAR